MSCRHGPGRLPWNVDVSVSPVSGELTMKIYDPYTWTGWVRHGEW